jgi:hypothetical protein
MANMKLGILLMALASAAAWLTNAIDWRHLMGLLLLALGILYATFIAVVLIVEQRRSNHRPVAEGAISSREHSGL